MRIAMSFPRFAAAALQRVKLFADAAEHGCWAGGAHLPFSDLGHLRGAAASGCVCVPASHGTVH